MKQIFTCLFAALIFFPVSVFSQINQKFLQKTEALIKQDKRVAAHAMNTKRGTVESIRFDSWNTYPASEIKGILQNYFINRKGLDGYAVKNETPVSDGVKVTRYQQYFKGIKIEFGEIVAVSKNEMMGYVNAENYIAEDDKIVTPKLSEAAALNKTITITAAKTYAWQTNGINKEDGGAYPKGELVLMPDMRAGKTGMVLAWKFDIYTLEPLARDYVYISAEDGSLVFKNAIIQEGNANGTAATRYSGTKNIVAYDTNSVFQLKETSTFMNGIETYNMNRGTNYGTSVIPSDNDNNWSAAEYNNANKDNALLDAHWGAEQVIAYWKAIHNRNSYDNNGTKLKSYVHYRSTYDNAFWNGSAMTYGDGSGGTNGFSPLTALDICAHEIGHGVCQSTANLVYGNESGALNEGFSDIWGACLENYVDPTNAVYEPFLIGEQITNGWVKGMNRRALRDMANPPALGNPDTYGGTYWVPQGYYYYDYGGVHTNSSVLNKWFFLITQGESGTNDLGNAYNVTGLGFTKSQKVAFLTELSLTPNADFAAARTASINAAFALFQTCAQEVISITNAWYAVGVGSAFNVATTCDARVSFLSTGATVSETNADKTSCHPGKNVTVTMVLSAPIVQNANVTINAFGTAKINRDFIITPSTFTFVAGGSLSYNFTVTVYDNHIVEGDRSLVLNYTVTGGAGYGSTNQGYTLKITDDDVPPNISSRVSSDTTLINESFNGTAIPTGWSTGSFKSPAGPNTWTFGSAANLSGNNAAYITSNTTTKPWDYLKSNSNSDVYLLGPSINANNIGSMNLSFKYACVGEATDNITYDYGSIVYTLDNGVTYFNYPNIQLTQTPNAITFTLPLPDDIFSNRTFRIGFRWYNDDAAGSNPPLAVDDVLITGTNIFANVETTAGHNRSDYVPISDPMYFYSAQDKQLIARIFNATETPGCVNASVTQSGTGQSSLYTGYKVYKRTEKVFNFTPDVTTPVPTYRLTVYFTPAELAIWGNKKLDLSFAAVRSGVNLNGNISSNDIQIITPLISNSGDGYISYTGQFTGFSQVMLVDPVSSLNCIANNILYVDSSTTSGDGLSWGTSLPTLTEALQIANQCPSVQEILVAKGTYYPTANNIRDSSFRILRNNLKMYGGYPSGGGTRNIAANPTILSGNIGSATDATDNNYHVMMVVATPTSNIDTTVRVDGFTITGGYANSSSNFTVAGQVMYHDNGGGIYCYGQNAGNSCKPLIANCNFYGNRADNRGGAVFNEGYNGGNSSPTLINCVFYNNTAGYANGTGGDNGGGSAVFNNGPSGASYPSIINCSMYGNYANIGVGAVTNYGNSSPLITNSIIYLNNNNTGNSNVANVNGANSFNISYSIVQGGPGGSGNINANPLFVNPTAGNLQLQRCSPAINTGNNTAVQSNITTDVANNPRIFNTAIVDMGAYEFQGAAGYDLAQNGDNDSYTINSGSTASMTVNCRIIAQINSLGTNPVSGTIAAKTWIESVSPTYNGQTYVKRHLELTPATNASTATASITVYASQQEFTDFNVVGTYRLPTGPTDAQGIANLRIAKFIGQSSNGSGLPGTYTQPAVTIDPDDNKIVWNTDLQRWEITFNVSGFSGFFIGSAAGSVLPVTLLDFTGQQTNGTVKLTWHTTTEINTKSFIVERSIDGINWETIGTVAANGLGSYALDDLAPLANKNFYRLKIVDKDGKISYSSILVVNVAGTGSPQFVLIPNPASGSTTLVFGTAMDTPTITICDAAGRVVFRKKANGNISIYQINTEMLLAGNYNVIVQSGAIKLNQKLVIVK